jgi:hypothetical protein
LASRSPIPAPSTHLHGPSFTWHTRRAQIPNTAPTPATEPPNRPPVAPAAPSPSRRTQQTHPPTEPPPLQRLVHRAPPQCGRAESVRPREASSTDAHLPDGLPAGDSCHPRPGALRNFWPSGPVIRAGLRRRPRWHPGGHPMHPQLPQAHPDAPHAIRRHAAASKCPGSVPGPSAWRPTPVSVPGSRRSAATASRTPHGPPRRYRPHPQPPAPRVGAASGPASG